MRPGTGNMTIGLVALSLSACVSGSTEIPVELDKDVYVTDSPATE